MRWAIGDGFDAGGVAGEHGLCTGNKIDSAMTKNKHINSLALFLPYHRCSRLSPKPSLLPLHPHKPPQSSSSPPPPPPPPRHQLKPYNLLSHPPPPLFQKKRKKRNPKRKRFTHRLTSQSNPAVNASSSASSPKHTSNTGALCKNALTNLPPAPPPSPSPSPLPPPSAAALAPVLVSYR